MANLNFDLIEIFLNKCKTLESYGYQFPYELDNASFNDIDYDTNGNLYTNIKVYKVVLVLDENSNTNITLAKEYRITDANNKKSELIDSLIFIESKYEIVESVERMYEPAIDERILIETEESNDFEINYTNVGNIYEIKIIKETYNSASEVTEEDLVTSYNWVLINQTTKESSELNETFFRKTLGDLSVILETTDDTSYTIIVEKFLSSSNIIKTVIINS